MPLVKHILDVGQCAMDAMRLDRLLTGKLQCSVERAHTKKQALALASENSYDLILVNRLLDRDRSSGIDLIAALHAAHPTVPLMLVSDYPEAQEEAVQAGALPGFGKSDLESPETTTRLRKVLS